MIVHSTDSAKTKTWLVEPFSMEGEVWKTVDGASSYEVSNDGRVRNLGRTIRTANGQDRYYSPKLCGYSRNQYGHLKVRIFNDDGLWKNYYVHHLVAFAFIGPRPEGMQALHGPLGFLYNTPENLSYGTAKKNSHDKIRDGTRRAAEEHPACVLDWCKVREIRARRANGERVKDLAEEFGVSRQNITSIVKGRSWVE